MITGMDHRRGRVLKDSEATLSDDGSPGSATALRIIIDEARYVVSELTPVSPKLFNADGSL